MRSVFVSQLSARVGDRELVAFFNSQAGEVREGRVIVDRISRRSKGVAYVEFRDVDTVSKAIGLSGTKLLGVPIIVQYTEAEKNRQAMLGGGAWNPPLYVGSLNFQLTDADIRAVFQPFGAIDYVDLHKDPITGKSKGYAFVQFRKLDDAKTAMEKMSGFQLAGRAIKVTQVQENKPPPSYGGGGGGGFRTDRDLDDGIGGSLNSISRIELMQKLARNEGKVEVPKAPLVRPNIPTAVSRCIVMRNVFNPAEETDPNWDVDLRDDIRGECESQFGRIVGIVVQKESTQGEVYIKFEETDAAQKAVQGLNGRYFGGKQIQTGFISDAIFDASNRK
ncbi:splicing factor CC1-like protein [Atractiella rhizophila]|nr:splicing factor CC1-like protein [Atractiella rhizophila]